MLDVLIAVIQVMAIRIILTVVLHTFRALACATFVLTLADTVLCKLFHFKEARLAVVELLHLGVGIQADAGVRVQRSIVLITLVLHADMLVTFQIECMLMDVHQDQLYIKFLDTGAVGVMTQTITDLFLSQEFHSCVTQIIMEHVA